MRGCLLLLVVAGCVSTGGAPKLDQSKLSMIKLGQTSRAQLLEWFGAPQSQGLDGDKVLFNWAYYEVHSAGFGSRVYNQLLSVSLTNDLVARVVVTDNLPDEKQGR